MSCAALYRVRLNWTGPQGARVCRDPGRITRGDKSLIDQRVVYPRHVRHIRGRIGGKIIWSPPCCINRASDNDRAGDIIGRMGSQNSAARRGIAHAGIAFRDHSKSHLIRSRGGGEAEAAGGPNGSVRPNRPALCGHPNARRLPRRRPKMRPCASRTPSAFRRLRANRRRRRPISGQARKALRCRTNRFDCHQRGMHGTLRPRDQRRNPVAANASGAISFPQFFSAATPTGALGPFSCA